MKLLAIASLALAANIAVGATSVTVYGYGADRESAKRDAFRTAIENVCGAAVLSDREHFNDRTVHNNVLSYSSCRVENYKIVEYDGNRIKVNVTLIDNKISQRLHSQSGERLNFDNHTVKAQVDSWKQEHKDGDKLIDEVFRDYPYRAYNLNQTKDPYIVSDSRRKIFLIVPYEVTWNYNFITAMNDTFSLFSSRKGYGSISVMGKNPNNLLLGRRDNYYLDDLERLDHIKSKFTNQNEMRIKVRARDYSGKNILNICYSPEYKAGGIFYSVGITDELTIFGNDRNKGEMKINLTFPADVIYDIYVDVVAARDCKL